MKIRNCLNIWRGELSQIFNLWKEEKFMQFKIIFKSNQWEVKEKKILLLLNYFGINSWTLNKSTLIIEIIWCIFSFHHIHMKCSLIFEFKDNLLTHLAQFLKISMSKTIKIDVLSNSVLYLSFY